MTDTALFIGWGKTYPGREHVARKLFDEALEVFAELKKIGEIEKVEPFLLAPHGGDLEGFFLVYGVPEKLLAIQVRDEVVRLRHEAVACFASFGIVPITMGESVKLELTKFDEVVTEIEREPVLV